jgi:hypothetical protein
VNGVAHSTVEDEEVILHENVPHFIIVRLQHHVTFQMDDEGGASDDFLEPNNRNDSAQVPVRSTFFSFVLERGFFSCWNEDIARFSDAFMIATGGYRLGSERP